MTGGKIDPSKIVDKKMMYLLKQGLSYALNPMTHIVRYMRGTEE